MENSLQDLLFEIKTPLGFRVRVTQAYWELISTIKHPVMKGHEDDVKESRILSKKESEYGPGKSVL
jgi:hypothetical protein